MYGVIEAGWKTDGGYFIYTIEVPANTSATVYLPNATKDNVLENGNLISKVAEISQIEQKEGWLQFEVGSGRYQFAYPWQVSPEMQ
jgi:alpha-L-rhamnosidase